MSDCAVFERVRTSHYMDRIDEELGRNASFFLVLAEAEQAQARDDDHRWVGIAKLGGVCRCPSVVVFLVVSAVCNRLLLDTRFEDGGIFFPGIPTEEQRTDASSQKMVRATRAERTQLS